MRMEMYSDSQVTANVNFRKGQLQLVAASLKVDTKECPLLLGSFDCCGALDVSFYMHPHLVSNSSTSSTARPWVVPFWYVQSTDCEDDTNVQLQFKKIERGGLTVQIPMLVNHVPIQGGERILKIGDPSASYILTSLTSAGCFWHHLTYPSVNYPADCGDLP